MFMTFKEFKKWLDIHILCGDFDEKIISYCNDVIAYIQVKPFWKRNRVFKKEFIMQNVNGNFIPIRKDFVELKNKYIDKLIKELKEGK